MKDLEPKYRNIVESKRKCMFNLCKVAKKEFIRVLHPGRVEQFRVEIILETEYPDGKVPGIPVSAKEIKVEGEEVLILGSNGKVYNWGEIPDDDLRYKIYNSLTYLRE